MLRHEHAMLVELKWRRGKHTPDRRAGAAFAPQPPRRRVAECRAFEREAADQRLGVLAKPALDEAVQRPAHAPQRSTVAKGEVRHQRQVEADGRRQALVRRQRQCPRVPPAAPLLRRRGLSRNLGSKGRGRLGARSARLLRGGDGHLGEPVLIEPLSPLLRSLAALQVVAQGSHRQHILRALHAGILAAGSFRAVVGGMCVYGSAGIGGGMCDGGGTGTGAGGGTCDGAAADSWFHGGAPSGCDAMPSAPYCWS